MANKSNAKSSVVTIALLVTIAVFGVVFGVFFPMYYSSNSKVLGMENISTFVKSSDGLSHTLNADVSVEIDKNTGINRNELQSVIKSTLSNLDYSKITTEDGIDYVQGEVAENLSQYYQPESIKNVYITSLISDDKPYNDSLPKINPALKGLFKNIK